VKHLDLFSGIGGFALAARWAGFETVQFVELEPFAQKVLTKNFPGVPIHGDIKTFQAAKFRGCKLITGGYPCQPFSQAGKRRGEEDDRHLWPEMFRVIREARPTWILCENVAGHITMGLDDVLFDLEDEGYACQTFVIPAVAKDARHRRDRVWIVAHTTGTRRSGGEGCMETDGCNLREEVQTRLGTSEDLAYSQGKGSRAHSNNSGPYQSQVNTTEEGVNAQRGIGGCNQDVPNSSNNGCVFLQNKGEVIDQGGEKQASDVESYSSRTRWAAEPSVGRVANGVPSRVDRLKGLGNAIVPQVAYEIMRCLK
jgi:DNA (cytosine-5)-methyltransferase 1